MNQSTTEVSVEFFPPKSEDAWADFQQAYRAFLKLNPKYFSVTYGAGGSTKARTFQAVAELARETTVPATPHLSCVGETRDGVTELLRQYMELGIKRLVVLRGDLPSGMGGVHGEFSYAADLVRFIRETTGEYFHISVAAYPEMHPQAASFEADLQYFAEKITAGANDAITQFFFNADAYEFFLERCAKRGILAPIFPGIMPIYNFANLSRFADTCGAEIPRWIRVRLDKYSGDERALQQFCEDCVTSLCEDLLRLGAPGLHFYSLNRSNTVVKICRNLGLL